MTWIDKKKQKEEKLILEGTEFIVGSLGKPDLAEIENIP